MAVLLTEAYNHYGPTFISAMRLYLRWRLSRARLQSWQSLPTCLAAGAAVLLLQCPPSAAVAHAGLHVENCSRWAVRYSARMPEQQGTWFFSSEHPAYPTLGTGFEKKGSDPDSHLTQRTSPSAFCIVCFSFREPTPSWDKWRSIDANLPQVCEIQKEQQECVFN